MLIQSKGHLIGLMTFKLDELILICEEKNVLTLSIFSSINFILLASTQKKSSLISHHFSIIK